MSNSLLWYCVSCSQQIVAEEEAGQEALQFYKAQLKDLEAKLKTQKEALAQVAAAKSKEPSTWLFTGASFFSVPTEMALNMMQEDAKRLQAELDSTKEEIAACIYAVDAVRAKMRSMNIRGSDISAQ
jgi:prefoldin subunit 5